jgi:hypothetical protein
MWKSVGRRRSLDPGVNGRIILKWIFRKWNMDWIQLTPDRDKWNAIVVAVMNLRVPQNARGFLDYLNTSLLLKKYHTPLSK